MNMRSNTTRCRDIEMRAAVLPVEQRSGRTIGGIATKYGARSRPMSARAMGSVVDQPFIEIFENRCWAKSEGDGWPDCKATLEHRDLLGTTAARTMRLLNGASALEWEVDCPNTNAGNEALEHVRIGNIRGSSVEMLVYDDAFEFRADMPIRHVNSARLIGVSAVCMPAHPDSSVSMRSLTFGLARQFDADPDEIAELVAQGEIRSLFQRTDIPTPLEVAHRSIDPAAAAGELELRRRRNAMRAREAGYDPSDPGQRLLEWYRRKNQAYEPVSETRSHWISAP